MKLKTVRVYFGLCNNHTMALYAHSCGPARSRTAFALSEQPCFCADVTPRQTFGARTALRYLRIRVLPLRMTHLFAHEPDAQPLTTKRASR